MPDTAALSPTLVHGSRLRILTALASQQRMEFVRLRAATAMTDGNLSAHARRLHRAGLIGLEKSFQDQKPITFLNLTASGRAALEQQARMLMSAVGLAIGTPAPPPHPIQASPSPSDDPDWVD